MTDAAGIAIRLVTLVFVPGILLSPLLFALLSSNRAKDESARALVRLRMIRLVLATAVALAFWLGAVLASVNLHSEVWAGIAKFSWILFFPLWFVLAMPILAAKNPAWNVHGGASVGGAGGSTGGVRTASLVNRQRKNPISALHWTLVGVACALLLGAIAARGIVSEPFADDAAHMRWWIMLGCYALTVAVTLAVMPWGVRLALREPEPMDAQGNPELTRMYDEFRTSKIKGLFWLLGVLMPVFFGTFMTLAVWMDSSTVIVWMGAVGGAGIGLWGAWFGTTMSLRRMRIAEFKETLEAGR